MIGTRIRIAIGSDVFGDDSTDDNRDDSRVPNYARNSGSRLRNGLFIALRLVLAVWGQGTKHVLTASTSLSQMPPGPWRRDPGNDDGSRCMTSRAH